MAYAELPRSLRKNPDLNEISNMAGQEGPGRAGQGRKDRAGKGRKEQEGPGRTGQERAGQEGKYGTRACPNVSSINSKEVVIGIALALR